MIAAVQPATFRKPSDRVKLYAWHDQALKALAITRKDNLKEAMALDMSVVPAIIEDAPQCGFYLAKVARYALLVPSKIWLHSEVDVDGELIADEVFQCQIGGEPYDVMTAWPRLCIRPISRAEYSYLMAVRAWAKEAAPDQPQAQNGRAVDWLTVKVPPIPATAPPKRKR